MCELASLWGNEATSNKCGWTQWWLQGPDPRGDRCAACLPSPCHLGCLPTGGCLPSHNYMYWEMHVFEFSTLNLVYWFRKSMVHHPSNIRPSRPLANIATKFSSFRAFVISFSTAANMRLSSRVCVIVRSLLSVRAIFEKTLSNDEVVTGSVRNMAYTLSGFLLNFTGILWNFTALCCQEGATRYLLNFATRPCELRYTTNLVNGNGIFLLPANGLLLLANWFSCEFHMLSFYWRFTYCIPVNTNFF